MSKEHGTHKVFVEPRRLTEILGITTVHDPIVQVLIDANRLGREGKAIRRVLKYNLNLPGFGDRICFELYWEKGE